LSLADRLGGKERAMTLENLDTLIAFAVVMLGVSLLIMILTQMISALLGYRGTNLRWGLQTLLTAVSPSLAPNARGIAEKILTDLAFSDSVLSKFGNKGTLRWRLASAVGVDSLARSLAKVAEDLKPADDVVRQIEKLVSDVARVRVLLPLGS
jgi:hypothetical protein